MANGTETGDALHSYGKLLLQLGGWAVVALFMYWLLPTFLDSLIETQREIKAEIVKVKENGAEQVEQLRELNASVNRGAPLRVEATKPHDPQARFGAER